MNGNQDHVGTGYHSNGDLRHAFVIVQSWRIEDIDMVLANHRGEVNGGFLYLQCLRLAIYTGLGHIIRKLIQADLLVGSVKKIHDDLGLRAIGDSVQGGRGGGCIGGEDSAAQQCVDECRLAALKLAHHSKRILFAGNEFFALCQTVMERGVVVQNGEHLLRLHQIFMQLIFHAFILVFHRCSLPWFY